MLRFDTPCEYSAIAGDIRPLNEYWENVPISIYVCEGTVQLHQTLFARVASLILYFFCHHCPTQPCPIKRLLLLSVTKIPLSLVEGACSHNKCNNAYGDHAKDHSNKGDASLAKMQDA